MVKVLFAHGGILNLAGTEAVMMNYYRNIDKKKVSIDFLVHGEQEGHYDKEILRNGNKIFRMVSMSHLFSYYTQLKKIFLENNYDIIHVHMNENGAIILLIAKLMGIKVRIVHSHNTNTYDCGFFKKALRNFEKFIIKKCATNYFSCGKLAAEALYGKTFCENHDVRVLNNGIMMDKYKFNLELREKHREELKVDNDTLVIGNVGRLSEQKNQKFLIDVAYELKKTYENFKIVIFGNGELENEINDQIKRLGLENYFIIKAPTSNVNEWYNAFDLFALSSIYEGLPVVSIEAQANGLISIFADTITSETNITGIVEFLGFNVDDWVIKFKELKVENNRSAISEKCCAILNEKGYNSTKIAKSVEAFYCKG